MMFQINSNFVKSATYNLGKNINLATHLQFSETAKSQYFSTQHIQYLREKITLLERPQSFKFFVYKNKSNYSYSD